MTTTNDITITCPNLSSAQLSSLVQFNRGREYMNQLSTLLLSFASGAHQAVINTKVNVVAATGALTLTGEPTAGSAFTVGNGTYTAGTGSTTGSTFQIGTSVTQTAGNIVSMIGSSNNGIVTATSNAGTVTFTAVQPGVGGNGIQLATNLGSSSVTAFSGGSTGTSYSVKLG